MIYTCTLNPSMDYRMKLSHFEKNGLNRANDASLFPGGKGVNVSIVLKNLGDDSVPLGFQGGAGGAMLTDRLRECHGVTPDFVHIGNETRINVKLKEAGHQKETEINAPAPKVKEDEYEMLLDKFKKLDQKDMLVLAGSDVYRDSRSYADIMEICGKGSVPFIIDGEWKSIPVSLKHGPLLIKPNLRELEMIEGRSLEHEKDIVKAGKRLLVDGARNVIVSMGAKGAYFLGDEGTYHAAALDGEVLNAVGAGDSMVAGFIHGYIHEHDLLEAFRWSLAAGCASAFSEGFADMSTIETYLDSVNIKKVE